MNNAKPDISVIIVSYNVWEYLQKCIDTILNQVAIISEIIVVDNNSSDRTVELLKERYSRVKVISNKANVGFSAANNQGIHIAEADIILLLNPDTELVESDTLSKMKKYLGANPEVGILAPCLLNTDGTLQVSFWKFPGIKELFLEMLYLHRTGQFSAPESPTPVEGAAGAALCFNKTLVSEIGGLDENLFWMEDIDLCYRAYKSGKRVIYHPQIKVTHHGGKSSGDNYSITIPNQVLSKIKFAKKHKGAINYFLITLLSLIFILSRLLVFAIISILGNKAWKGKAIAYGRTLKGFFSYVFMGRNHIIR